MDKKEAIVITNRKENSDIVNVYRNLRLNLKDFNPEFILPIIVPPEKHGMIFFQKLMGLNQSEWSQLVDLFYLKKWKASLDEINAIVGVTDSSPEEMAPIRNNLVYPIASLHDSTSLLMPILEASIHRGAIIIIDISRLNSKLALWLSSFILKRVFNENQTNFIQGSPDDLMRATFAIDEAQSVLSKEDNVEAFVELAKEGRKYSLGGIFITQQPGSIPFEILSQGDNFFVFHLLSRGDLDSLQRANAHYSNDIVTQALNEPKRGKSYMWTSAQPFVLPVQVSNFEEIASPDKARDLQQKSRLSSIVGSIQEELKNPVFKSIITKYLEVEKSHAGDDLKPKSYALFGLLNQLTRKHSFAATRVSQRDQMERNLASTTSTISLWQP